MEVNSEKRLDNTIFIMYLATENYRKTHNMSVQDFLEIDKKYDILNYIAECPDIFDNLTEHEMIEEIDNYVSGF